MSLLRAGLWLSAGIALGRLAGFVREALLARQYGLGPDADVAVVVLTLPDSLLNLLVGSAMGVALVPALAARRAADGQAGVDRLHGQVALLAVLLGIVLTVALTLGAAPLVHLLAPGLAPEAVARCAGLVDIALWAIPLTVLSAVVGAGLQERERFATTALGTLWFNAAVIVALLVSGGALVALAGAMVVGAALRLAGQLGEWRAAGGGWSLRGEWLPDRRMAVAYGEILLAGAALLLLPLAGRWFASLAGEGAIAAWTYATRLFELPLQVMVTVFATALFPRFTRLLAGAAADPAAARGLLVLGLRLVLVLAVVAAVVGACFAADAVRLAFAFHDGPVAPLAAILLPALPFAGATALLQAWSAAGRDTRTPLLAGALGVALFLFGGGPVLRAWGLPGLAWLMLAQHALVALALAALLARRAGLDARTALGGLPRLLAPALAAGAAATGVCLLSPLVEQPILRCALAGGAGAAGLAIGLACLPGLRRSLRG